MDKKEKRMAGTQQSRRARHTRCKVLIAAFSVFVVIVGAAAFVFIMTYKKRALVDEHKPGNITIAGRETETAGGSELSKESGPPSGAADADGGTAGENQPGETAGGQDGNSGAGVSGQEGALVLEQAKRAAAMYDYDKAIAMVQAIEGYEANPQLKSAVADFEAEKSKLVPWTDMSSVTHIFFHSLIWDSEKAFSAAQWEIDGYNMYMTTAEEFKKILQSMYDRGYVMVSLHDLVKETTDDNGKRVFKPNDALLLPPGKIPFVMSQDDVCFYHYMDGDGFATKIVIGEDGKPTCEYVQDDGTVVTGAYELVPILDAFVEEHPDFSYRGRKAILALTGYNGVLGYRTDPEYKDINSPHLVDDQVEFLKAHPDFNWDQEVASAKAVAQCLKEDGYEFASHTWGHIYCDSSSMDTLAADTKKWEERVAPIVGETDILIFPHGADFGDWHEYSASNERFNFFKEHGFDYFCNVDGNRYFVQITGDYVRTGRRNVDGYRMYDAIVHPEREWFSDLFDVKAVFDPDRPVPVPGVE